VTAAFRGPAFSETGKDWAAMDVLLTLSFGPTSELYKRLVEQEQKVDQLFIDAPATVDPSLVTVFARVKRIGDAVYVRDEILSAFRRAATETVPGKRLADALSSERYGLLRTLDNTEQIASTLARFVRFFALPEGPAPPPPRGVAARRPRGIEVEIVRKETRATAISLGHPIEVTRAHPDFAALSVARAWLGEHRSSQGRLFRCIRELRGLNYGDYAYIEAFPHGMFQFFPSPNVARRAQLFEIWIRPVAPENAQMALRIALHELDRLVEQGLTAEALDSTREYLMKNVYLLTATQDRDAEGLRDRLLADEPSRIRYDAAKPEALLAEDEVIGARKLALRPEAVRITPVEDVFAR